MQRMHDWNPAEEWNDTALKRRFRTLYADVHFHGDGGWRAACALNLLEDELIERDINPAKVAPGTLAKSD
jgi:hypothetical protein